MSDKVNKPKTIRWGIIGCGDVTEVKSGPAYQQTEGFEVISVMRRNEEKLKDYALRHGIRKYTTDADQLINDPEVDAVYIATPPDTHKLYALKVAEAGKPCCVEKPLSPSYEESLAIYSAFENKNIPLFTSYYRRSLPRFQQVYTWLKNDEIGEIRHINWHLSKAPSPTDLAKKPNWRTDPVVAPGGYFDDLASHGLDLFAYLLGEMKQVNGISINQQQLYGAKDAFAACWIHEGGATGAGSWNFGCDRTEDRVEIYGSKGKIQFAVFEEVPVILDGENKQEELFIEHPKSVQLHHVENMKKHLVNKGFIHPSSGGNGLHTSWVMDKILSRIN
ncbi:oxidoreductase [Marivirga lumbricoides]|uniref:Oxidoreductase n=1 Tax=Marivirga lumbricoides TaxID=1046115 RepID=A0ABQ1MVP3_9BACT|nr:oxidoreductase [Marivirga lumbricoides]